MNQFIKKYWYVILVSIVFLFGIGLVIINSQKGLVATKQVDGQYVISSMNGSNFTADELYEMAKERYEAPLASLIFEKEVLERTFEYSEDEKVEAKLEGEQTVAYYKSMFGEDKAEEIIQNQLQAMGYDADSTLVDYYLNASATTRLLDEYYKNNVEANLFKDEQPLIVSHILVRPSEDEALSDEEVAADVKKRQDAIDEALKTKEFGEVAKELSEDPGSAQNNGSLGLVYKSISFHPEFLDATYKLKVGEVGDWIESPSGFHKILVTSNDQAEIEALPNFTQLRNEYAPSLRGEAFMALAEKLNIDFSENPEFEQQLKTIYGLGDQK